MTQTTHRAEIWQDGLMVACVEHDDIEVVRREIANYAMQYAEDGPLEIKEVS